MLLQIRSFTQYVLKVLWENKKIGATTLNIYVYIWYLLNSLNIYVYILALQIFTSIFGIPSTAVAVVISYHNFHLD